MAGTLARLGGKPVCRDYGTYTPTTPLLYFIFNWKQHVILCYKKKKTLWKLIKYKIINYKMYMLYELRFFNTYPPMIHLLAFRHFQISLFFAAYFKRSFVLSLSFTENVFKKFVEKTIGYCMIIHDVLDRYLLVITCWFNWSFSK